MFMKSSVKLTLIIIFSVLLLLLPTLLRTYSTKLGEQTYFYERISDLADKENKLPIYDELSYGSREFIFKKYFWIKLCIESISNFSWSTYINFVLFSPKKI